MLEFDTIKELYIAIKNGELQESKLRIVLDNDCTLFYYGDEDNRIVVRETNGYNDIELLYKLLFQKADVRLEKKCSKNLKKEKNYDILNFIYERMISKHKEKEGYDYMINFKRIINRIKNL